MPFYEYKCGACGHDFEAMQKISDGALRKCPSCGKSRLKKLMSAPSFRLKGAGWYETDFKGDKDKQRNIAGETEKAADKDKPVEKPADTEAAKPAEKTTEKPAEKPADKSADKPSAAPDKKITKTAARKK